MGGGRNGYIDFLTAITIAMKCTYKHEPSIMSFVQGFSIVCFQHRQDRPGYVHDSLVGAEQSVCFEFDPERELWETSVFRLLRSRHAAFGNHGCHSMERECRGGGGGTWQMSGRPCQL